MMLEASEKHSPETDFYLHESRAEHVERIGIMVSGVVALFLLSPLLRVPEITLPLQAFGSPLHLTLSRELLVGVMAGALAWVGTRNVLVAHPAYEPGSRIYSHRILPALMAIAATVLWQKQDTTSIETKLMIAAGIGVVLSLIVSGQYVAVVGDSPWIVRLRTALNVISLSVALYLWIIIYGTRARSLVTASASALLGLALTLDVLQYETVEEARLWQAGAVIGLVVGEAAWALNFWRLSPVRAGFILLIASYVLIGLTRRLFQDTLNRLTLLEHAVMALLLLFVMHQFSF